MAHLADRFRDELIIGFDEAQADPRALIAKLRRQREVDNAQIVKALEIAGREIAMLKVKGAAPAGPTPSGPARMSSEHEALSEKLRAQSIADSRSRG